MKRIEHDRLAGSHQHRWVIRTYGDANMVGHIDTTLCSNMVPVLHDDGTPVGVKNIHANLFFYMAQEYYIEEMRFGIIFSESPWFADDGRHTSAFVTADTDPIQTEHPLLISLFDKSGEEKIVKAEAYERDGYLMFERDFNSKQQCNPFEFMKDSEKIAIRIPVRIRGSQSFVNITFSLADKEKYEIHTEFANFLRSCDSL